MTPATAIARLIEARDTGIQISSRSFELLTIETDANRVAFINDMKDTNYVQQTLITCMETLKKENEDLDGISLLVVGTEAGAILILPQDPINSSFLCRIQLPSTPAMISISGIFDVEWRISVICRDGRLYSIKNGEVRGSAVLSGSVIDLGSQAIAIAKQDKNIWVATMERVVNCYSNRGKRLKGIVLNEDVSDICSMVLKRAKLNFILLIALATGELLMYRDLSCVYTFKVALFSVC
jgi:Bardet-Biedl syndrome 1 protein